MINNIVVSVVVCIIEIYRRRLGTGGLLSSLSSVHNSSPDGLEQTASVPTG